MRWGMFVALAKGDLKGTYLEEPHCKDVSVVFYFTQVNDAYICKLNWANTQWTIQMVHWHIRYYHKGVRKYNFNLYRNIMFCNIVLILKSLAYSIAIYCNILNDNHCIVIRIVSPDSCQYTALIITSEQSWVLCICAVQVSVPQTVTLTAGSTSYWWLRMNSSTTQVAYMEVCPHWCELGQYIYFYFIYFNAEFTAQWIYIFRQIIWLWGYELLYNTLYLFMPYSAWSSNLQQF